MGEDVKYDTITFKVSSVHETKIRKAGETVEKSILMLNAENQEKATIECPDLDAWKDLKAGDVVKMSIVGKQRSLKDIEAEEKAKADARKKEVDAAKEKSARMAGAGPKKTAST